MISVWRQYFLIAYGICLFFFLMVIFILRDTVPIRGCLSSQVLFQVSLKRIDEDIWAWGGITFKQGCMLVRMSCRLFRMDGSGNSGQDRHAGVCRVSPLTPHTCGSTLFILFLSNACIFLHQQELVYTRSAAMDDQINTPAYTSRPELKVVQLVFPFPRLLQSS